MQIPRLLLTKPPKVEGASLGRKQERERKLSGGDDLLKGFLHIHEASKSYGSIATPRRYVTFITAYQSLYSKKKEKIELRQNHLKAGVSKLNEAKGLVDSLKSKAAKQGKVLAEKQAEADQSLKDITSTMQGATDQKAEMEGLKKQAAEENKKLEKRKREIETELAEINPLVEEAKAAVGSIKGETLGEIRSLRAPPDIIRDILEGVLKLMGTQDTSWVSMKK